MDTTSSTTTIVRINSLTPLLIGRSGCTTTPDYFGGNMDELRFWSKALSICEIQNNISCQLSPNQPNLLFYYRLKQGRALENNNTAVLVADSSGNGFNGVLYNFALSNSVSNWIAPGAITYSGQCNTSVVWLGITNNWNNPINWSSHTIPTKFTQVVVNTGTPYIPEISGTQNFCYSLKLNNGAFVSVKNGGKLNITGKQ